MSAGAEGWTEPSTGPLRGVRVVDFTQAAAGPFCAQHLGDMGATVTKIEPPAGDMVRGMDDPAGCGFGTYFMGLNRNKRFVRIDLATERGRAVARRLCRSADVLVENHRPGTMQRLGLGYEQLAADNPGLVYTSVSAFGEAGPLRDRPGMDIIVQGFAGIMGIRTRSSCPTRPSGPPTTSTSSSGS